MTNTHFTPKYLRTTIVINQGSFEGQDKANTITLERYRTSAAISNAAQSLGSQGMLYLSIWGMRESLL